MTKFLVYNKNNNNNYYYYGFIEHFFSRIQKHSLQRITNSNENKKNEKFVQYKLRKLTTAGNKEEVIIYV